VWNERQRVEKNSALAAFPAHFSLPLEQARLTLTNGGLLYTTEKPFKQISAQDTGWKCPLIKVVCHRLAKKGYHN